MSTDKNQKIKIRGARVHNLKNVSLEIPKNKLVIFTGVSGSGKSSLAFDTIFVEGQRRYIESLSPYVRQFLGQSDRPDVDDIEGLSPAIAINQKAHGRNPRSIVATLTEVYDYLRVLYARIGKVYCPKCGGEIKKLSAQEIVDSITNKANKEKAGFVSIFSPVVRGRKGEYYQLLYDFLEKGYEKAKVDGKMHSLHNQINLAKTKKHDIEILIDKVDPKDISRLTEAVEDALNYSKGLLVAKFLTEEKLYSSKWSCPKDEFAFPEIEPRLFSFNSPHGACEACSGLGKKDIFTGKKCPECKGKRLKDEALAIKLSNKNIHDVISLNINDAYEFFVNLEDKLSKKEREVAKEPLREVISRLSFLLEVGLNYMTLNREASTLSGGEAQRIRLASQIGSKLAGTLYVLDEPTIGLHERDNERLINTLKELKKAGNTVLVVEHDERTIMESDHLVELGPGPGRHGGEVVVNDEIKKALKSKNSSTVDYLTGKKQIELPERRSKIHEQIKIIGAKTNNIKNINVNIPLKKLVCLTGVSGSGKSSLLYNVLHQNLANVNYKRREHGFQNVNKILGLEYLSRVIEINQSPIGRSPRSNPATYTGIWTPIRDFFAELEGAKERGYRAGRFSFNKPGGRCEACDGVGFNLVEMHFLPAVSVRCDVCHGKRFNRETMEIKHRGKNISDVLDMNVEEAYEFFKDIYTISDKLKVLKDVGLGYIKLGQPATTLSGGEAQRIKLAKELSKPFMKNAIYLLDEPSTGLHYKDIKMLLAVLQKIVEKGNTVIVIEHNMHIIKTADYVVDMGPDGGDKGGQVVAKGTPEEVAKNKKSYTGKYLRAYL